ncbi:AAC(3) family N-acetyltransferase [Vibrio coralliirubri]|uniref:AAC(3) family N-acetyltransferase n=1 Tax=Vibrio coralliirubri TaxID=1516159 RepID=UPI0013C50171|nr:AAC(3) family N-acetyltransferase [Vibrio coralliirubri]
MRVVLRRIVNKHFDNSIKKKLKKTEFRFKSFLVRKSPLLTKEHLKTILTEKFNLREGDNVFCHASLSHIRTNMSEEDILGVIFEVLGEDGSLTVPCYTPISSKKYMLSKKKFDVSATRSGMGSFAEYVRKHPKSIRSLHPTKSIASIGLSSDVLEVDQNNLFPFGKNSPYERLLDLNVKIIGIGVTMNYLSFVHVGEELDYDNFPIKVNEDKPYSKLCKGYDGIVREVHTFVHDMDVVVKANPYSFIKNNVDNKFWITTRHYFSPFFYIEGKALTQAVLSKANDDITIYN